MSRNSLEGSLECSEGWTGMDFIFVLLFCFCNKMIIYFQLKYEV